METLEIAVAILLALAVAGLGAYTLYDWFIGVRWAELLGKLPSRMRDAWDDHWRIFGAAAVLLVIGGPSVYRAITYYQYVDTRPPRAAALHQEDINVLFTFAFDFGVVIVALALLTFLHQSLGGGPRSTGLDTVYNQGSYDAGDFASEDEIDRALHGGRGPDPSPEFDE